MLYNDRESLVQEDIVVWINIGMHHFPQAEVIFLGCKYDSSTYVLISHRMHPTLGRTLLHRGNPKPYRRCNSSLLY